MHVEYSERPAPCPSATSFAKAFFESADRRGFVVVAPEGLGNSFNAGACCGLARREAVDDVSFLCAVKQHLKDRVLLPSPFNASSAAHSEAFGGGRGDGGGVGVGGDDGLWGGRLVEDSDGAGGNQSESGQPSGGKVGGGERGGGTGVGGTVTEIDAFAFGWSNGGYLATLAAASIPGLFRAIAPVSGYQYNLSAVAPRLGSGGGGGGGEGGGGGGGAVGDHMAGGVQSRRGGAHAVPIFMHHSKDDPAVRFQGCCAATGGSTCCCGISEHGAAGGGMCTSADEGFNEWARDINGCGDGGGDGDNTRVQVWTRPLSMMGKVHLGNTAGGSVGMGGVTCVEAMSCVGRSVFCTHESAGHFAPFSVSFPRRMQRAAFEFFEQHASSPKPRSEPLTFDT